MTTHRLLPWLALWSVVVLMMLFISLNVGTLDTEWQALWQADHPHHDIIWQLRWPRAVNALLVGACLALAGLLIQNMVKNPLADPYLLGVSGGAATVQLSLILLASSLPIVIQVLAGFAGSILAAILLLKLSYFGQIRTAKLTLNGVVLAFGFAAIISFLLAMAPPEQMKSMMFWLMGDLSFAQNHAWQFMVLLLSAWVLYSKHRPLDILARGEWFALKTGVDAAQLNLWVFGLAALLTSVAVAQAGTIAFVGLVVPHMVRLMAGNTHRVLIPLSLLAGAAFLLAADTLSRTVLSPLQLPVGIFTAVIGVPVFLILNRKTP